MLLGSSWSYQIEPYVQFTSINGDAGIGRVTGVSVDVDFEDILENLEMAGMLHFEAHHDSGWGLSLDYGFMDLAADISGPRGGILNASVRQGVFEALAMKRMQWSNGSFEYFGGVRWWDNDIDITVDPAVLPGDIKADIEQDWVDLIVGVRWVKKINDRWQFVLRGDLGGLGLESDWTSSVSVAARYSMTERWTLDLQYKALSVEYEDGSRGNPGYFSYDTVTHGPIVGFIYAF